MRATALATAAGAGSVHAIRRVLVCLGRVDGRIGRAVDDDVRAKFGDRVCDRAKIGHVEIGSAQGAYVRQSARTRCRSLAELSVRASDQPARHRPLIS